MPGSLAERNEIDRTGNISQLLYIYVAFFRYSLEDIHEAESVRCEWLNSRENRRRREREKKNMYKCLIL
jgi:hypothetical protein